MILTAPKLYANERIDLEDLTTLFSAGRTDSKYWTKEFLSASNFIFKGFTVSGIGSKTGTINMTDATLIMGGGTGDFSFFVAPVGGSNITIASADLVAGSRNYVELELSYTTGTPIVKAFWDVSANAGLGAEFSQQVNTVEEVAVSYSITTGGFTGNADHVPLAIIDTDGSGNITVILDQRPLFGRLGLPTNISNTFSWSSNVEPSYTLALTSVTGTFVAGEVITFSGGVTATCTTEGTSSIAVNLPSAITFTAAQTVTGGTSGATGTVASILESFSGADKDLKTFKDMFSAIMTEIKRLKGTSYWYQLQNMSNNGIASFLNAILIAKTSSANFSWSGTNLSITDSNGSPSSSDILGAAILFSRSQTLSLLRADGTASTATIPIADGSVLFINIPASGNRSFSGNGTGATNYQVTTLANFTPSDNNFWIAYRSGSTLYVRGGRELDAGAFTGIGTVTINAIYQLTGDINAGPASGSQSVAAFIQPNVVSNSKLAQMGADTLKGNNTGGTANAADLSVSQVTALLGVTTATASSLAERDSSGNLYANQMNAVGSTGSQLRASTDGSNFLEMQYVNGITLTNNQSSATAVDASTTFAFATYAGFQAEYYIKDGSSPNLVQMGRLSVVSSSTGSVVSITEQYNNTSDLGVTFTAVTNGSNVELRYTTTNTSTRTMRIWITRFLR